MSLTEILAEIPKLSFAERQELVRSAIAIEEDEVTPEENAILDQRLADFRRDPTSGIATDDFKSSPDALTGLEANLRFAGPETLETKIFGRLTAWQNWIFQRANAIGEQGTLKLYGSGVQPTFDRERV